MTKMGYCEWEEEPCQFCDICGDVIEDVYFQDGAGQDVCKECYSFSEDVMKLITLDNVIEYAGEEKEMVLLNHALYWFFETDEIEEILTEKLRGLPEQNLNEKLNRYVREDSGEDIWDYINWLAKHDNKAAKEIKESEIDYDR